MSRLVLDAGAFIACERGNLGIRARILAARRVGVDVVTPSPVIGQVWRNGRRQALLALIVAMTKVVAPDTASAQRAGELLAATGGADVVDALVVGLCRDGDTLITSDPDDLDRLLAAAGVQVSLVKI